MKKLRNRLILLSAVLFFAACGKEETTEKFDCISGVLSAGENVTAEDFSGIEMVLGKFLDEVEPSSSDFQPEDFDFIRYSNIETDGSFIFENLDHGNYVLAPSQGFIFAIDTFAIVRIDGKILNHLNKTIERGIPENCVCW